MTWTLIFQIALLMSLAAFWTIVVLVVWRMK